MFDGLPTINRPKNTAAQFVILFPKSSNATERGSLKRIFRARSILLLSNNVLTISIRLLVKTGTMPMPLVSEMESIT